MSNEFGLDDKGIRPVDREGVVETQLTSALVSLIKLLEKRYTLVSSEKVFLFASLGVNEKGIRPVDSKGDVAKQLTDTIVRLTQLL